ncbi:PQQ-binding-like beta-propeller repeat protein [Alienimonas californiensis]|uniref:Serine/threonine-protein kinase AfsK n=1 Tax=Alienimonas californiensis TaxID=2527989 RepID=A0A517P4S1_9PLAN|nr:PQQ-binding-like beta-propeller repeat protein [Alienimonas californiensis]QDT14364.1 Serine/threonine-protein kinase AfsK [Alienimonas californiensis]
MFANSAVRRSLPRRLSNRVPRRLLRLICAALCAATLGGAPAFAQNMLPAPRELQAAGLEIAWWAVAAVPAGRGQVEHLTADENAVYVQTNDNLLTAINLTSGAKKWAIRVGRDGQTAVRVATAPPVEAAPGGKSSPGLVLACVGRTAYGIHQDTGETMWALPLPQAAVAAPTIGDTEDGRRLFVPTVTGSVYSFDMGTIEDYHMEKRLEEFATGTQRWRYETGSPLIGGVVVDGIAAVFANVRGVMYGVDAEKRELLWRFETDGQATAPIVAADGVVYVASSDRNLYAVDITNGLDRWEFVTREPVQTAPAVVQGALYVTPGRGGVARLDRDTGRAIWQADRTTGFLGQAGERAYVSDFADNVVALDLATGRRIGSVRMDRFPVRMQNALTDRVIVSNKTGIVLCLKAAGSGFPVYFANPERRPVEPNFADDAPADQAPAPPADPAAAPAGAPAAVEN